jgi:hypothetical protein
LQKPPACLAPGENSKFDCSPRHHQTACQAIANRKTGRNPPFRRPGCRRRLASPSALWLCAPALLPVCPFEDVRRQALEPARTRDPRFRSRSSLECRKDEQHASRMRTAANQPTAPIRVKPRSQGRRVKSPALEKPARARKECRPGWPLGEIVRDVGDKERSENSGGKSDNK